MLLIQPVMSESSVLILVMENHDEQRFSIIEVISGKREGYEGRAQQNAMKEGGGIFSKNRRLTKHIRRQRLLIQYYHMKI
uniref:Uncharacterized protein n=1 Tax=Escherichia coli TaxID=562 RepID=A0A6N0IG57_ECOLX|nr:hypothetical protein HPE44_03710 [Escherichia coli]